MARRATAIKRERADNGNVLLLDAGSTLLGQPTAMKTRGQVIVEAMNKLGYDAMTVGRLDFLQGKEVLLARAKEARFAMVSANLVVPGEGGKSLLPSHTVVERSGWRIAIVGLTGERDLPTFANQPQELAVTNEIVAMKNLMNRLRDEADLTIVVSHLGEAQDQVLATEVPGIAVIVGGVGYSPADSVRVVPGTGTLAVYSGAQGEYLGILKVKVGEDGKMLAHEWQALGLGDQFADDAEMVELIAKHR